MKIEGYISKKNIRRMLNNYQAMAKGDYSFDEDWMPKNSGPKSIDGVTGNRLNKIMLDQAIEHLEPDLKACTLARWVYRIPIKDILANRGISKDQYYFLCDIAVDKIYYRINGEAAVEAGKAKGAESLLKAILHV